MENMNGGWNGVESKQVAEMKKILDQGSFSLMTLLSMTKDLSKRAASYFAEEIASSSKFSYKDVYEAYSQIKSSYDKDFIHRFEIGLIKRGDIPKYMAERITKETFNLSGKLPSS